MDHEFQMEMGEGVADHAVELLPDTAYRKVAGDLGPARRPVSLHPFGRWDLHHPAEQAPLRSAADENGAGGVEAPEGHAAPGRLCLLW